VRKIFGEKGDCDQTLHAVRVLNEAMWQLLWGAFPSFCDDFYDLREVTNAVTVTLSENKIPGEDQLGRIKDVAPQIASVMEKFNESRGTLIH